MGEISPCSPPSVMSTTAGGAGPRPAGVGRGVAGDAQLQGVAATAWARQALGGAGGLGRQDLLSVPLLPPRAGGQPGARRADTQAGEAAPGVLGPLAAGGAVPVRRGAGPVGGVSSGA